MPVEMTQSERKAVLWLGEAWNAILECVADPQSRAEACAQIHQLQNLVLAQATIRSAPDLLRPPPPASPTSPL